ncbi:Extracellular protein, partial [Globisporangium splendens]
MTRVMRQLWAWLMVVWLAVLPRATTAATASLLRPELRGIAFPPPSTTAATIDDASLLSIRVGVQQDQPESLYLLAMLQYYGHGVDRDVASAVKLLRRAAQHAHRDAEFALGVLHSTTTTTSSETASDGVVQKSKRLSAMRLANSANRGHVDAKWMLAILYNDGCGVKKNVPRAVELLQDAVRDRNPHAQFHLGVMHEYGRGVPQNFTQAALLYASAAERGVPDAMHYLGLLYAQGRGVSQSFASAMALFRQAAADPLAGEGDAGDGHAPAMYALGQMHANSQGTAIDYTLALTWLRKAERRQDPRISGVAKQVADEIETFLEHIETRVQEQEQALGAPIKVTVGVVEQ